MHPGRSIPDEKKACWIGTTSAGYVFDASIPICNPTGSVVAIIICLRSFTSYPNCDNKSASCFLYRTVSKSELYQSNHTIPFGADCSRIFNFEICSGDIIRSWLATFKLARLELVKISFTFAIVLFASFKDSFASFNLAAISGLFTISRTCAMLVLICSVLAANPNTCCASSKFFDFSHSRFIETRTVSFDNTGSCNFASPDSF